MTVYIPWVSAKEMAGARDRVYASSMVGVATGPDSKKITVFGHGLTISARFELSRGITVHSEIPDLDLDTTVAGCGSFPDYAAAIQGAELSSFAIDIESDEGGQALVVKAWNALWLFHLLSVACQSPCLILYSMSDGPRPVYSAVGRSPFTRRLSDNCAVAAEQLIWAKENAETFYDLIKVPEFSSAMRCFGNAHYLPDADVRIMLLWAGIEGLLSVDAELSRRLALYAALIIDGAPDEKANYFEQVKRAYSVRSRAVHGGKLAPEKLAAGCASAGKILIELLARCVEIKRVPSPAELDRLAVGATIS